MADEVSQAVGGIAGAVTGGLGKGFALNGVVPFMLFFAGFAVLGAIIVLVWWFVKESKTWNIKFRVHMEDPDIKGVSLCRATIMGKRVRFKDGKVVYLYKTPIQGYTISPELLIWTRPSEHDIIITQDKKLFCITKIESIDVKRKQLSVGVNYPDIEMDRQDLQNFIDSKKYDDPTEKFKAIVKVVTYLLVFVAIIVLVVLGGKTYIDNKNVELQRDVVAQQVSQNNLEVMKTVADFAKTFNAMIPALQQLKGGSAPAYLTYANGTRIT